MTSSRAVLVGLSAIALLVAAGLSLAAPQAGNPGTPFQALHDQHMQIQEKVEHVDEIIQFWVPETVEQVEFNVRLPKLEAEIDTAACEAGFPACGLGQSGPATNQNDRPIRMVMLVSRDGVGVEGLTADAFTFDNAFFPAGGLKAVPCDTNCGPMWFYEGGSGLYTMFLEPFTEGNWKAGRHSAAVSVALDVIDPYTGTARGTTLVAFDIPSVPGPID